MIRRSKRASPHARTPAAVLAPEAKIHHVAPAVRDGAPGGDARDGRRRYLRGVPDPAAPSAEPLDVVIVGGGVNGAGIARDAAGRGWRVLLLESPAQAGAPTPPNQTEDRGVTAPPAAPAAAGAAR